MPVLFGVHINIARDNPIKTGGYIVSPAGILLDLVVRFAYYLSL